MTKEQLQNGLRVMLNGGKNKKIYTIARFHFTGDKPNDAEVFLHEAPLAVFYPDMLDLA